MKMTFRDLRLIIQEELNNSMLEDSSSLDLISGEEIEVMTHALGSVPKKKKKKKSTRTSGAISSGRGGYVDDYYDDMIYSEVPDDEDDHDVHDVPQGEPDGSAPGLDGPADSWDDDVDDSWGDMDMDLDLDD